MAILLNKPRGAGYPMERMNYVAYQNIKGGKIRNIQGRVKDRKINIFYTSLVVTIRKALTENVWRIADD